VSNFLKATAVRDNALRALALMTNIAPTVWRDAGGSFRGALGDAVTIRVPAYTEADERNMRNGGSRTRRGLFESKVVVTLDKNLYRDVPLTDPEQTLDIMSFSRQVANPVLESIARGIEKYLVANAISTGTYAHQVSINPEKPLAAITQARTKLNKSNVPATNRSLAVGADVAEVLLNAEILTAVDQSGSSEGLREGVIGRLRGMPVIESNSIAPDKGYAYHQSAYALSLQAPIVPDGAPAGFTATQDGFAIRMVQVMDSSTLDNILAADVFIGAGQVKDWGSFDENGIWVPTENPDDSSSSEAGTQQFIRAVELTLDEESSSS